MNKDELISSLYSCLQKKAEADRQLTETHYKSFTSSTAKTVAERTLQASADTAALKYAADLAAANVETARFRIRFALAEIPVTEQRE